jgi:hypothetical protein
VVNNSLGVTEPDLRKCKCNRWHDKRGVSADKRHTSSKAAIFTDCIHLSSLATLQHVGTSYGSPRQDVDRCPPADRETILGGPPVLQAR